MLMRSRLRRSLIRVGLTAAGVLAVLSALGASAVPAMAQAHCREVSVPVTLAGGSTGPVVGTLCVPDGAHVVQVLVHGFSYDQYYFASPYQPQKYSLAHAAAERGHATLALSRLGVGESYHPPSAQVTLDNNAAAVHQIVTALRSGELGERFEEVVLVGHSYGSLTSWLVAGRYGDVDAVVATGASHRPNFVNVGSRILAQSPPAAADPKFAGAGLDPGYVTTRPGARTVFYNLDHTDPALVALDEKLKQTGTLAEVVTYLPDYLMTESRKINLPVLAVNGTDEPFFCNGGPLSGNCSSPEAYIAGERGFYGPEATLDAIIVPNAGHNVTLARSAPETIAKIQDWIVTHTSGR